MLDKARRARIGIKRIAHLLQEPVGEWRGSSQANRSRNVMAIT
jgi:hypothetical protein